MGSAKRKNVKREWADEPKRKEPFATVKHPIFWWGFWSHRFGMRKTGNGHNVDIDTLLEDIRTVVRDGQELLKLSADQVKEKAVYGARQTDRAIRRNPYQTIGFIFGFGLIVGLLASGAFLGRVEIEEE